MPSLVVAESGQVDTVYRESHAMWGAGLSSEDYRELWEDLLATEWGGRHATFLVWLGERGELLSSLKVYRLQVRIDSREVAAIVLGAIFTPSRSRRRGHASQMIRALLHRASENGTDVAMLYSDIGTRYYEELGFRNLPAEEQWGILPGAGGVLPRGWTLRPMTPDDLPDIVAAHHDFCVQQPFAVLRNAAHWEFLRVRSMSFFARLGDPSLRFGCRVALCDGEFAGYLVDVRGHGEWNLREVGAVGGDPQVMETILRLGADDARGAGLRHFYGWLPRPVASRLGDWKLRIGPRHRALPMLCAVNSDTLLSSLDSGDDIFIPFQDQF